MPFDSQTSAILVSWPVALPRVIAQAQDYVDLAISPDGHMMLSVLPAGRAPAPEVLISSDTGRTWMTMRAPSWDHTPCTFGGSLATAAPHTFWLLCLGGAAAGSSTKGLLRTTDMGRTWSIMSAAPSLTRPPPPGAISLAEPSSLAAGSPTRLWLALTNGLTESDDAGRRWTAVGTVRNLGGWSSTLSVLNARHAWLLAAGAGLWRTTDGAHWQPVGALNTN